MCCYVVSKLVIKSCTEPLRADDIMRSPAAASGLVPDRRRHPMTNVCLSVSKQWGSTPSIGNETPLAAPLLFNPLMT